MASAWRSDAIDPRPIPMLSFSEASLSSSQAATTPLSLVRLALPASVSEGFERRGAGASSSGRSFLSFVDVKASPAEIFPVKERYRLGRLILGRVGAKGKASWAARLPVGGEIQISDCPCLGEMISQLWFCGLIAEIPHENLGRNGNLVLYGALAPRCGDPFWVA